MSLLTPKAPNYFPVYCSLFATLVLSTGCSVISDQLDSNASGQQTIAAQVTEFSFPECRPDQRAVIAAAKLSFKGTNPQSTPVILEIMNASGSSIHQPISLSVVQRPDLFEYQTPTLDSRQNALSGRPSQVKVTYPDTLVFDHVDAAEGDQQWIRCVSKADLDADETNSPFVDQSNTSSQALGNGYYAEIAVRYPNACEPHQQEYGYINFSAQNALKGSLSIDEPHTWAYYANSKSEKAWFDQIFDSADSTKITSARVVGLPPENIGLQVLIMAFRHSDLQDFTYVRQNLSIGRYCIPPVQIKTRPTTMTSTASGITVSTPISTPTSQAIPTVSPVGAPEPPQQPNQTCLNSGIPIAPDQLCIEATLASRDPIVKTYAFFSHDKIKFPDGLTLEASDNTKFFFYIPSQAYIGINRTLDNYSPGQRFFLIAIRYPYFQPNPGTSEPWELVNVFPRN